LIEAPLTQAFSGQRHGDERVRSIQVFIEAMLQELREKFAEQAAEWPLCRVLEA